MFLINACGSGSSSENSNDNKPEPSSSAAGYKPDAEQAASIRFFTVGDIDNPALVSLTGVTDHTTVSDQKIVIKADGNTIFDGTETTKATYDGKVTLGIPVLRGIAYSVFNNITADATIDITVSAKVNGKNIAKTFSKTKTPFTDIYSWRDLDKVRNDLSATASYTLNNDIAFPAEYTYGYTDTFNPIGDGPNAFLGKFDGTGKTISGLKITGNNDYAGLFGRVTGADAEIKNLVIDHRGISGKRWVGALASRLQDGAVLTNVGMISTTGAKIFGNDNVGGLAGDVRTNSTLTGYATGAVSGNNTVGGLTGWVNDGTVTGYSTGKVSGTFGSVGGLAGTIIVKGTVTGYATGKVSGTGSVGGLVGGIVVQGNLITDATVTGYSRGKITRSDGTNDAFGLLTGNTGGTGSRKGYHSVAESRLLDISGDSLTGTTGLQGNAVNMIADTKIGAFGDFDFSNNGKWIWVKDGNWPAINIGTIKPASEQPIAP